MLEQSIIPVPEKYSLGTKFTLSNNLFESISTTYESYNFDGYFRRGDSLYGTILWDGYEDQKRNYKLEIEKLYACTTHNDIVPIYDPDGSIYNKGAQFGCTRPDKSIKNRILILDRSLMQEKKDSKLSAKYFSEMFSSSMNNQNFSKYLTQQQNSVIIDGFKFNVDYLFDIEKNKQNLSSSSSLNNKKDIVWFVQAVYSIRPFYSIVSAGQKNQDLLNLKDVYNNGTNIQIVRLTTNKKGSIALLNSRIQSKFNQKDRNIGQNYSSGDSKFMKLVMPVILCIVILVLFISISIIYLYNHLNNRKGQKPAALYGCLVLKNNLNFPEMNSIKKRIFRTKNVRHDAEIIPAEVKESAVSPPEENVNLLEKKEVVQQLDSNLTFQTSASSTPSTPNEDQNNTQNNACQNDELIYNNIDSVQNKTSNNSNGSRLINDATRSKLLNILKRFSLTGANNSNPNSIWSKTTPKEEIKRDLNYEATEDDEHYEYDLTRSFIPQNNNFNNLNSNSRNNFNSSTLNRFTAQNFMSSSIHSTNKLIGNPTTNNNYLYFNYKNQNNLLSNQTESLINELNFSNSKTSNNSEYLSIGKFPTTNLVAASHATAEALAVLSSITSNSVSPPSHIKQPTVNMSSSFKNGSQSPLSTQVQPPPPPLPPAVSLIPMTSGFHTSKRLSGTEV